MQMPEQRAVELNSVADEAFAMIDQQPQVEFGPVEVRGGERVQAFLQNGAGDVERVDRVGLAPLASALSLPGRQVRRDPQHPLAALDQEALQRPGHVPAILQRPDQLIVEAPSPTQQRVEGATSDLDRLLAEQLARCGCDGGDRVRPLVSVRAEHDHGPRPSC
jgi:hypothetical protein